MLGRIRGRWLFLLMGVTIIVFVTLTIVFQQQAAAAASALSIDGLSSSLPGSSSPRHGGVSHIVLMRFKDQAAAGKINKAARAMMDLKTKCIHPITKRPYIRSIRGGANRSLEEFSSGLTHAFIIEFDSIEHRDYYVEEDPRYQAYLEMIEEIVDNTKVVLDFTDGKFT